MNDFAINPRLLQRSLQDDICAEPSRELTDREKLFVDAARKHYFTVLFDITGRPYAFGARNNTTMLEEFGVKETRWPFDDTSSMYTLKRRTP